MGVGEASALASESIDVRRLYFRGSVAAEVAVTEIVSEYDDDVGRRRSAE